MIFSFTYNLKTFTPPPPIQFRLSVNDIFKYTSPMFIGEVIVWISFRFDKIRALLKLSFFQVKLKIRYSPNETSYNPNIGHACEQNYQ